MDLASHFVVYGRGDHVLDKSALYGGRPGSGSGRPGSLPFPNLLQHPQHQQRILAIYTLDQRVPIPLTCPDTPRGIGDVPAFCLKLQQGCFNRFSRLHIAFNSSGNGGNELPMLAVNVVAIALKSCKRLALAAAVISCIFGSILQVGDTSKYLEVFPDF
jgi:hypothetical protein